ncbi:MAG TPA: BlaI/MecI/CopY family transcriptional regulator [Gemmatimonadaceae bacterium]|jgi:predicted transcriptional regulator
MEISFTDREFDVMAVLWERGSGTVAEVRDALSDELAYNTVLTVLRTLQEKGYARPSVEGRAHRYYPTVTQHAAGKSALGRVLAKVFAGSSELLLTQLVSERAVDADELRRLRKLLDERLASLARRRPKS